MLIQIRREEPTAVCAVEEQHHALSHVDEEPGVGTAPKNYCQQPETLSTLGFGDVLDSVLVTTTFVVLGRAAHSLPAKDFAAEQAHAGIGKVFAGCWAATFHHFVL